jgi:transcription elongation factor Elf1
MVNKKEVERDIIVVSEDDLQLPCWLCGEVVSVKFSSKDKPYLICSNCGIQTFVRYRKAHDLLLSKVKEYTKEGKLNGKRRIS